jgi:hypothetical protein
MVVPKATNDPNVEPFVLIQTHTPYFNDSGATDDADRQGAGTKDKGKGKTAGSATSGRQREEPLTAVEEREYRRIVRELKRLPHAMRLKNSKVADQLGIDIATVVKAAKWGRKHKLL